MPHPKKNCKNIQGAQAEGREHNFCCSWQSTVQTILKSSAHTKSVLQLMDNSCEFNLPVDYCSVSAERLTYTRSVGYHLSRPWLGVPCRSFFIVSFRVQLTIILYQVCNLGCYTSATENMLTRPNNVPHVPTRYLTPVLHVPKRATCDVTQRLTCWWCLPFLLYQIVAAAQIY